jgi:hypothetical protein
MQNIEAIKHLEAVPPDMLEEIERLQADDALTMGELRRLCAVEAYAEHMRLAGMNPALAPYWLAHNLKVQR